MRRRGQDAGGGGESKRSRGVMMSEGGAAAEQGTLAGKARHGAHEGDGLRSGGDGDAE